jgi:hypothetical protein
MLVAALASSGCTKSDQPGNPPELLPSPDASASPGAAGTVVTDWRVGKAGGDIASSDKSVSVHIDRGAADEGTTVRLTSTPSGHPALADAALAPVATISVTATTGALRHGRVSVRYDAPALKAAGSSPDLLMTLLQDSEGHWSALDTTIDPAASTATAEWPHFSSGVLGGLTSAGQWFVNHVATYGLGPEKPAKCNKKAQRWRNDAGWSFKSTNATGGRMLVPPLDGCASTTDERGRHHLEITNRYWYAFRAPMPQGANAGMDDVLEYSDLEDVMLGGFSHLTSGDVLIPGHSRAWLSVKTQPAGQEMIFDAEQDRVSLMLAMIASLADVASLAEAKAARAALKAALTSLDRQRAATGKPYVSDIATITGDRAWEEKAISDSAGPGGNIDKVRSIYERVTDGMELLNCARDVGEQYFDDSHPGWGPAEKVVVAVADQCRKEIARYVLGSAFKFAVDAAQGKMASEAVKGLLDAKSELATLEDSTADWVERVGKDYRSARLTGAQARDPRYDPLDGFNWATWLQARLGCDPELLKVDRVTARVRLRTDLTGDGAPEWVVVGECPYITSAWPLVVEVIDGRSDTATGGPKALGRVGGDFYWRTLAVTTTSVKGKPVLKLAGKVLGPGSLMCCPNLRVTLKVQWRNGQFAEVSRQQVPI